MLDAGSERVIAQVSEHLRHAFGEDLVSVVLYGSAAGHDFVPGHSNINLAIVLTRVTFVHLKVLHAQMAKWHRLGLATPLLLDRQFLERGRDVFPMEFHDIKAQHRVLYGEEVFARLPISEHHLRYQAEHELRGKLLRLRALFAEVGAERPRLQRLMLDSEKTFLIIMRNLLRLRGGERPRGYRDVLDRFEQHFGLVFPSMRQLLDVRSGHAAWPGDMEAMFGAYLSEVERLVDCVDQLERTPDSSAAPGAGASRR